MSEEVTINQQIHLIWVALTLTLIAFWAAMRLGFFQIKNPIEHPPGTISLKDVLLAFGVFLGIGIILMPVIAVVWMLSVGRDLQAPLGMLTQGWFNVATIIATAIGMALFYVMIPASTRLAVSRHEKPSSLKKVFLDFGIGSSTWLVGFPLVVFVGQIVSMLVSLEFPSPHIDQVAVKYLKTTMNHPPLFVVTAILLVVVVPVMEELLFRGFLQTWLRKHMGMPQAIGLASLIFALFHFAPSQGIANAELLTSLFILSCFLGFLYERQQSLLASIGLHVTFNAVSVLMVLFNFDSGV